MRERKAREAFHGGRRRGDDRKRRPRSRARCRLRGRPVAAGRAAARGSSRARGAGEGVRARGLAGDPANPVSAPAAAVSRRCRRARRGILARLVARADACDSRISYRDRRRGERLGPAGCGRLRAHRARAVLRPSAEIETGREPSGAAARRRTIRAARFLRRGSVSSPRHRSFSRRARCVDSRRLDGGGIRPGIEVRTPIGVARDTGTQFGCDSSAGISGCASPKEGSFSIPGEVRSKPCPAPGRCRRGRSLATRRAAAGRAGDRAGCCGSRRPIRSTAVRSGRSSRGCRGRPESPCASPTPTSRGDRPRSCSTDRSPPSAG